MMKSTIITIAYFLILTSCLNPKMIENQSEVIDSLSLSVTKKFLNVPTISADLLAQIIEEKSRNIVIVDARNIREQKISMLKNSISHIEFNNTKDNLKDSTIITYSTIGGESSALSKALIEEGFKSKSLYGGTLMWAQKGYTFISKQLETTRLGIENEAWNILPTNYEGVFP